MRPDKQACRNCSKEIDRGKWCSDKCRKAYGRKSDNPDTKPGQKPDKSKSDTQNGQSRTKSKLPADLAKLRDSLTKTDKTFFDRAIKDFQEPGKAPDPYYRFDGKLRKADCAYCGEEYQTNLNLNRYCSYQHYSKALEVIK